MDTLECRHTSDGSKTSWRTTNSLEDNHAAHTHPKNPSDALSEP